MTDGMDLIANDIEPKIVQRILQDEFVRDHIEVVRVMQLRETVRQTVIIPVFNQEPFILRCLQGVSRNLKHASDLVVILDSCTDQSEQIVLSFLLQADLSAFGRITVLRTTYPIFETRCDNLGICLSRGDYVIEIQSDIEVQSFGFDDLLEAPMRQLPQVFSTSGRGGHWFGLLLPRRERLRRFPVTTLLWEHRGVDQVGYTGMAIEQAPNHVAFQHHSFAICETIMRGPWCLRKTDLVALNLLDEVNLFLGNDDHDLHARATLIGLKCAYVPMRFNSPLKYGSTRQPRVGRNLEAYQRLSRRPDNSYLSKFLHTYSPRQKCAFVSDDRPALGSRIANPKA
jgi:glycosyltransferase involved in cell wall biosynthesis